MACSSTKWRLNRGWGARKSSLPRGLSKLGPEEGRSSRSSGEFSLPADAALMAGGAAAAELELHTQLQRKPAFLHLLPLSLSFGTRVIKTQASLPQSELPEPWTLNSVTSQESTESGIAPQLPPYCPMQLTPKHPPSTGTNSAQNAAVSQPGKYRPRWPRQNPVGPVSWTLTSTTTQGTCVQQPSLALPWGPPRVGQGCCKARPGLDSQAPCQALARARSEK